ncbi:MAG: hypothetical protein KJO86_00230 [Muriicola sp.]|nr:hypothetical protein [Muriicola sp.]
MEILTKLNAKTVSFDSIGGIPDLTAHDVCSALSGADEGGLRLLLSKILGVRQFEAIYRHFYPMAIALAKKDHWKLTARSVERISRLLELSIYEYTSTNVCPSCNGTKYSMIDKTKLCGFCRGSGRFTYPDRAKAEFLGVKGSSYSRTWRPRADKIVIMLGDSEYLAKKHIRRRLV